MKRRRHAPPKWVESVLPRVRDQTMPSKLKVNVLRPVTSSRYSSWWRAPQLLVAGYAHLHLRRADDGVVHRRQLVLVGGVFQLVRRVGQGGEGHRVAAEAQGRARGSP